MRLPQSTHQLITTAQKTNCFRTTTTSHSFILNQNTLTNTVIKWLSSNLSQMKTKPYTYQLISMCVMTVVRDCCPKSKVITSPCPTIKLTSLEPLISLYKTLMMSQKYQQALTPLLLRLKQLQTKTLPRRMNCPSLNK